MLCQTFGWEKNCTWRLLEDVWATPTMSWKYYFNKWLGRQQCYSDVGTFKINNRLHFHRCFSHNKICFGFTHRSSFILQASECDILKAFQIIDSVKQVLQNVRSNIDDIFALVYVKMTEMARLAGLEGLTVTRKCGRQTTWNNILASTTHKHFKTSIFISFLDCFLWKFNSRFTTLASQTVLALNIIPAHVEHLTIQTINSIYERFGTDLDSTKTSFEQEATVWKTYWTRSKEKPGIIAETLRHPSSCIQMFPNVIKVL